MALRQSDKYIYCCNSEKCIKYQYPSKLLNINKIKDLPAKGYTYCIIYINNKFC